MNKKRKISFYKLTQEKHTYTKDTNTMKIKLLSNQDLENNFSEILKNNSIDLDNKSKAITVKTSHSTYVVEIVNYADKMAFIKIGQQNPSNTVALRDQKTLETETVPMTETQLLELFTFCCVDFETGIVSYIGINGAPKVSALRSLFDNILIEDKLIYTKLASIMTNDILQTLVKKRTISKLSLTVAVPTDDILSDVIGLDANSFDALQHVKTRTATYKIVATRNKNIFQKSNKLAEFVADVKNKFGDNLKGLSANAKDDGENSQAYDLLQYSFTKTVVLGTPDANILTQDDFKLALENTYNQNKDELLRYIK